MSKNKPTLGDAIEDEYYANQGVRTGNTYNEYLVTQRERRISKKPQMDVGSGGNGGGGILVLSILFLAVSYIIGAGYVLSAELISHYWLDHGITDHSWLQVFIFVGVSFTSIAFVSRFWGLLLGICVGLIPALPLYFSTKGGVKFWFIVHNGGTDHLDNVISSWIALIGMISIHFLIAYSVQKRSDSFSKKLLRWRWIRSPTGIVFTIVLIGVSFAAIYVINEAISQF